MVNTIEDIVLDYEWITLIKEAKVLGITIEEIRLFLNDVRE
ncbi:DNA-binding anti-repressor SinI [Oceanobacillus sp. 143]|uniref:Sin domain-containing protein n=1 Tax=Oceanobacillus zhaokaii TaxID=2052660 RepID=A0A345PJ51_9BACI|nr:anti-repressor SinI family protein [Oceanobacillus zhaokaii]AXI10031.1 hypothetical protein CUC15_14325 [Oceanobacillus zhaokaii]QGS69183.1 DNA-binding anti-repressor SinI [Oceanobacillus sp. 143]